MSTQQPEALRLAALVDAEYWPSKLSLQEWADQTAAELRRLHAINAELLEALKDCVEDSEDAVHKYITKWGENYRPVLLQAMRNTVANARAAISKAEGREA